MTASSSGVPVAPGDRVSDVIARDEALVDVFVSAAPHFSKLRNRTMRRVMARLITVEQAARTAGIPAERLVRDLNAALGFAEQAGQAGDASSSATANDVATGRVAPGSGGRGQPDGGVRDGADAASPRRPADAPVREVDVREDLRSGNEPFSKIMAAVAALGDGEILRLRTTFEPVPLFTVLGKRGFVHESEEHGADDWSVWFWRPAGSADKRHAADTDASGSEGRGTRPSARPDDAATVAVSGTGAATDTSTVDATSIAGVPVDETTLVLDVRGLNPPEPLMRTLAALETLPEGHQLLQVNARVPQFLFPMLVERGFACDVDESHADRVLVRIWRPA
ncbi:MAG TPA: DUF2249 domain-containing protein [Gemmatimonadaceae bacterium]|nr:DUF2249 domain-containing protein [Gemmatimonadaceae bacterium]